LVAAGIRFNDFVFSEPTPLGEWIPPKYAGLFAILARDPNWAPKPFQPLFFGEFGNNARATFLPNDAKPLPSTLRADALFVAVLPMPFSTTAERAAARDQLVWGYNPLCQANRVTPGDTGELARKLEALEKKHEEQTNQVGLLLANINRFFEPRPEPPRRHIGFLPPQSAPAAG
jgi:hypothetical protein